MAKTTKIDLPEIQFKQNQGEIKDFEIMTLQSLFRKKGSLDHSISKPHRVHFNVIIIITKGEGEHFIDFKKFHFSRGSTIFISHGQVHAFEPQTNYDGYLIIFNRAFFISDQSLPFIFPHTDLYGFHQDIPLLLLAKSLQPRIFQFLNDFHMEFELSETKGKSSIMKSFLNILLLRLIRELPEYQLTIEKTSRLQQFQLFKDFLVSELHHSRNAEYFAKRLNISYRKLNELCKMITSLSAKEYIDQQIILESKRFLVTTDYSIKEISYKVGFDEPTNFQKYFKKKAGVTPTGFRENYFTIS